MKSMSESSMFQRLKSAAAKVKEDHASWFPYLLVPMIEEPSVGTIEKHGWENRQAGMISIRNSYAWHGEVTIAFLDHIRPATKEAVTGRPPLTLEELRDDPDYRGQFLKPYPSEMTGSLVAQWVMEALTGELIAEGWKFHTWSAQAGPSDTPDRRVAFTLFNLELNQLCTIYCNIIAVEWQDPELAAFRVKGTMYKSIVRQNYDAPNAGDVRCFFNDILPGLALNSAEQFQKKYDELVDDDWYVHAFFNDGRFWKMIMVDPNRIRAKILFHRMTV
jgi:hypothetical protein